MKRKVIYFMISIMSLFLFTGCSVSESDYTTEEATTMMKEYIKEKYNEDVEFEYVKYYNESTFRQIKNMGYYAKTIDGYYIRLTDFKGEYETDIRDTKQFDEIQTKINEYISNNQISDKHIVSIKLPEEENEKEFFEALWGGFNLDSKYNNEDVAEFLTKRNYSAEAYYGVDADSTIEINIAFFTNNDVDNSVVENYTKTLAQEFSSEVVVAVSYDYYKDSNSAIIFCETTNPYVSKAVYKSFGSYNDG